MSEIDNIFHPQVKTISRRAQPKKVWMTTFTDMIALMLTFFVMTYAMSEPKQEAFDKMKSEAQVETSKFEGPPLEGAELDTITLGRLSVERSLDLDYLQALLEERMADVNLSDDILLSHDTLNQQLVISLPSKLGFVSGSSDLSEEGQLFVSRLAPVLSQIKNSVEITGHADTSPLSKSNALYASNWDLSLQRALSVANELKQGGYERDVLVTGQAHTQQELLSKNISVSRRRDLSRRVDILINKDSYKSQDKP